MSSMEWRFPAIRGRMGRRNYYLAQFPIEVLPRLFTFVDWAKLPPEMRAQRVLNEKRIPEIARYVLDNDDDWVFSSLTASFDTKETYKPSSIDPNIGILQVPMNTSFLVNDGQHRLAALRQALEEDPSLGQQTISVVLFKERELPKAQQMFSDLNRTVQKTSRSLDILYDHRDPINKITLDISKSVPIFRGRVEVQVVSLASRSPKFTTLSALYNANERLLGPQAPRVLEEKVRMEELTDTAAQYWEAVTECIPEWTQVLEGDLKPAEARAEYVSTHAVALWALGSLGRTLIAAHERGWEKYLAKLASIDWRRTNPEWQGIAMLGPDIVSRRQTRDATTRMLEWKLGLRKDPPDPVFDPEEMAAFARLGRLH